MRLDDRCVSTSWIELYQGAPDSTILNKVIALRRVGIAVSWGVPFYNKRLTDHFLILWERKKEWGYELKNHRWFLSRLVFKNVYPGFPLTFGILNLDDETWLELHSFAFSFNITWYVYRNFCGFSEHL